MLISTTDPPEGSYSQSAMSWTTSCSSIPRNGNWQDTINLAITEAYKSLKREAEANRWTGIFGVRMVIYPVAAGAGYTAGFCVTTYGLFTR